MLISLIFQFITERPFQFWEIARVFNSGHLFNSLNDKKINDYSKKNDSNFSKINTWIKKKNYLKENIFFREAKGERGEAKLGSNIKEKQKYFFDLLFKGQFYKLGLKL